MLFLLLTPTKCNRYNTVSWELSHLDNIKAVALTKKNTRKGTKIGISDESQSVVNDRSSCYCISFRVSVGI